jgi:acetyl-CoA acetyltransferase
MRTIKDQAAIVGIGATEFSKNSGRSSLQLAAEAVTAALDDCGLTVADVDGMTQFFADFNDEIEVARTVGIGNLHLFSRIPHGGGASTSLLHQAAMAIATGICEVVVCYRSLNGRSGEQRYSEGGGGAQITTPDLVHWGWYMPYGLLSPASWVAMFTRRYMHQYGVTSEDLGRVAVATRNYAVTNPKAPFYQKPLTLEQHQQSRWIVEPLHLYDCCQETDGACAVVVTTPQRARDLKQPPALIRAVAQGVGPDQEVMTSFYREDITRLPEFAVIAQQLYRQAGLGPGEIDAANIYDAFTPIVLFQLEEFGFAKWGEARDFVNAGGVDLTGRLPTNTNGGQLSEAYIHGVNGIVESVRLIRGTSVNQPPKPIHHVLVTSGVGVPTSAAILAKA